jgi:protein-tyrosine phosphatase
MGNTACTEQDTAYLAQDLAGAHALFREAGEFATPGSGSQVRSSTSAGLSASQLPPPAASSARGTPGVSSSGYYNALKAIVFSIDKRGNVKAATLPLARGIMEKNEQIGAGAPHPPYSTPRSGNSARIAAGQFPAHHGLPNYAQAQAANARRPGQFSHSMITPRHRKDSSADTTNFSSNRASTMASPHLSPMNGFDDQTAVLVLHIQRRVLAAVPAADGNGAAEDVSAADDATLWANALLGIFTPRGLSETFSMDMAGLRWRAGHNVPGGEVYEASVYAFNGRRAHPLVLATATACAFDMERYTIHDMDFVRFLFHNGVAASNGINAAMLPVDLSDLANTSPGAYTSRSLDLPSVSRQVRLLKMLYPRQSRHSSRDSPASMLVQNMANLKSVPVAGSQQLASARNDPVSARGPAPVPAFGTIHGNVLPRLALPTAAQTASNGATTSHAHTARASAGSGGTHNSSETPNSEELELEGSGRSSALASAGRAPPPRLPLAGTAVRSNSFGEIRTGNSTPGGNGNTNGRHGPGLVRPAAIPPIQLRPPAAGTSQPVAVSSSHQGRVRSADPDAEESLEDIANNRMYRFREAAPIATEVLPFLFVGGEMPAADKAQLISKKITHVCNCAAIALPNSYPDLFEYLPLRLSDSPDEPIFDLFAVVVGYIERSWTMGGKTLVHCNQGVSRSCSFAIAYIMWKQGQCYDAAYDQVRAHRTICSPNPGFMVKLLNWEQRLRDPDPVYLFRFGPYSLEYPTPFLFKDLKLYTTLKNASADADTSAVQVIDPRHVYLIVAASPPASLLLVGDQVHSEVVEAAKTAAKTVLFYGFYGNKDSHSEDRNNRKVEFKKSNVPHHFDMQTDLPSIVFSVPAGIAPLGDALQPFTNTLFGAAGMANSPARRGPQPSIITSVEFVELLSAWNTPEMLDMFREAESAGVVAKRNFQRRRKRRDAAFEGRPIPTEFSSDDEASSSMEPPLRDRRREDARTATPQSEPSNASSTHATPPPQHLTRPPSVSQPTVRALTIRQPPAVPPIGRSAGSSDGGAGPRSRSASGQFEGGNSLPTPIPPLCLETRGGGGGGSDPDHPHDVSGSIDEEHPSVYRSRADEDDIVSGETTPMPSDRVVVLAGPSWSEVVELFDFDDLDSDEAYVVFARPRSGEEVAKVYLWIGGSFHGPPEGLAGPAGYDNDLVTATLNAFHALSNRRRSLVGRLKRTPPFDACEVEVVIEDSEPDEFIAVFS